MRIYILFTLLCLKMAGFLLAMDGGGVGTTHQRSSRCGKAGVAGRALALSKVHDADPERPVPVSLPDLAEKRLLVPLQEAALQLSSPWAARDAQEARQRPARSSRCRVRRLQPQAATAAIPSSLQRRIAIVVERGGCVINKASVVAFTRALALQLAEKEICVSGVAPESAWCPQVRHGGVVVHGLAPEPRFFRRHCYGRSLWVPPAYLGPTCAAWQPCKESVYPALNSMPPLRGCTRITGYHRVAHAGAVHAGRGLSGSQKATCAYLVREVQVPRFFSCHNVLQPPPPRPSSRSGPRCLQQTCFISGVGLDNLVSTGILMLSFFFFHRRRQEIDPSVVWRVHLIRLHHPIFNRRYARSLHPAVCAFGAPTGLRWRARRRLRLRCGSSHTYPVSGPVCNPAFFGGPQCILAA